MALVVALAAALWGMGALMGAPHRQRWIMIGALYLGVLLAHFVFPEAHPVRQQTGGEAAPWLLLGGAVLIALVYREGLRRLRLRANPTEDMPVASASRSGSFTASELDRYARHIVLRELGGPGQKRLKQARVLVIGAGGLGSPALLYLAAAGVGRLGVIDPDTVDNANLQRQVLFDDADIGVAKVRAAQARLQAQNPTVDVRPYERRLTGEIAAELLQDYDIVLDGSDNFETRYLANRVAVAACKPLVSGALSQWEGQISVFDPAQGAPCYQCIFPEAPAPGLAPSCAEAGVLGPLPGVVGAMMAVETIKVITGAGQALRGEMLIYDALYGETRKMRLKRREDCPVCG